MQRFALGVFIILLTSLTLIEVRPVSNLERIFARQRRQHEEQLIPYPPSPTTNSPSIIGEVWNDIQPVLNDHLSSHLSESSKLGCRRITTGKYIVEQGDYVEYCLEKVLNRDGQSYSTRTSATLYRSDGTIHPLHQAESNIEIETYNHLK